MAQTKYWESDYAIGHQPRKRLDPFESIMWESKHLQAIDTERSVVLDDVAYTPNYHKMIKPFMKQHRLRLVNYGWNCGQFVLTFKTSHDAAYFKIAYNGEFDDT